MADDHDRDHDTGFFRPGMLKRAFWGAVKLATVGLAAAVAWQVFLDPIFFPIFHDTTNTTAQATISLINDYFSWIPDLIGLTGDGGLLNTEFGQAALEPYYELNAPTMPGEIKQAYPEGFSADFLLGG